MTLATDPIVARILARLDAIEERLLAHRTEMQREWGQARDQRDALGRELDAFNVEMVLVQVDLKELRQHMADLTKNSAEITAAVDAFVLTTKALVSEDRQLALEPFARALGTLIAVVIGAASVQAASAVVGSHRHLEGRIEALEARAVGEAGDGA